MGTQNLLLLIELKILIIMTSLQNIVILGDQGLLMLMGSKFLMKMIMLQNILTSYLFQQGYISLWLLLFYTWGVLV